jgi:hypothetical protein
MPLFQAAIGGLGRGEDLTMPGNAGRDYPQEKHVSKAPPVKTPQLSDLYNRKNQKTRFRVNEFNELQMFKIS